MGRLARRPRYQRSRTVVSAQRYVANTVASGLLIEPVKVVTRRSTDSFAIEDPVVAAALRFIREQAVFGCRVRDVVRQVGVSRSVLERRFQQHLKRSPQAEIRSVQFSRGKQLLAETEFTLQHIAELSGFEHPEYLSVAFKKAHGLTPGSYRRKHHRLRQRTARAGGKAVLPRTE